MAGSCQSRPRSAARRQRYPGSGNGEPMVISTALVQCCSTELPVPWLSSRNSRDPCHAARSALWGSQTMPSLGTKPAQASPLKQRGVVSTLPMQPRELPGRRPRNTRVRPVFPSVQPKLQIPRLRQSPAERERCDNPPTTGRRNHHRLVE
jgi:hypothetical protein